MKQIQTLDAPVVPAGSRHGVSGAQKAAVLLAALGEDLSSQLLKQLAKEEVQLVSLAMASLPVIPAEQTRAVLLECEQLTLERRFQLRGGVDFAKNLLTNTFGTETAGRILERLPITAIRESSHFRTIQKAEPQQLAKILEAEHPQTIAIVLSRLTNTSAANLLRAMSPQVRSDVTLRMASLEHISPDVIQKIVTIIGKKLNAFGQLKRESFGGVRAVADVLNQLDAASAKEILESIEAQDPKLAESVRQLMFVFEDLLLIDSNGMKEVVSRVDRKLLTVALKGTSENLRTHFTQCMSQRGAAMLLEDMEALGPTKIKDVEAAQKKILDLVREMEAEGVLSVKGEGAQQYVV